MQSLLLVDNVDLSSTITFKCHGPPPWSNNRLDSHDSIRQYYCGLGRLDFKHIYALRCFKFWKSVYVSSNVVLRTVFSCCANSQDFNQLCCSYGVSVMGMNFSELTSAVYEHFRTSIM